MLYLGDTSSLIGIVYSPIFEGAEIEVLTVNGDLELFYEARDRVKAILPSVLSAEVEKKVRVSGAERDKILGMLLRDRHVGSDPLRLKPKDKALRSFAYRIHNVKHSVGVASLVYHPVARMLRPVSLILVGGSVLTEAVPAGIHPIMVEGEALLLYSFDTLNASRAAHTTPKTCAEGRKSGHLSLSDGRIFILDETAPFILTVLHRARIGNEGYGRGSEALAGKDNEARILDLALKDDALLTALYFGIPLTRPANGGNYTEVLSAVLYIEEGCVSRICGSAARETAYRSPIFRTLA